MAKITFLTHDGQQHVTEADSGSVMEAAIDHGVPGIDADCGGCCSCATCHVYVAPEWRDKVGQPEGMEADMLEVHDDRQPGSRLSCQIPVREELDGLVVTVPQFQL